MPKSKSGVSYTLRSELMEAYGLPGSLAFERKEQLENLDINQTIEYIRKLAGVNSNIGSMIPIDEEYMQILNSIGNTVYESLPNGDSLEKPQYTKEDSKLLDEVFSI